MVLNSIPKNFRFIYLVDFFSILSKHEEHNKCPFFIQNVLVDLSISLRQIKHLNKGVTIPPKLVVNLIPIKLLPKNLKNYMKSCHNSNYDNNKSHFIWLYLSKII